MTLPIIAINPSHNSSIAVYYKNKINIIELERFLNYKNSGMAQYMCPKNHDLLFLAEYIPNFIREKLNIDKFENCYYLN
jgi:hypothetical protein